MLVLLMVVTSTKSNSLFFALLFFHENGSLTPILALNAKAVIRVRGYLCLCIAYVAFFQLNDFRGLFSSKSKKMRLVVVKS